MFVTPSVGGEDQTLPAAEREAGVQPADGPGDLRHRGAERVS